MSETICFDFRIIDMPDGNQVIDMSVKTPYEELTALQMTEYVEMANQISYMDMLKRREQRESGQKRKFAKNPLYRIACAFGLV